MRTVTSKGNKKKNIEREKEERGRKNKVSKSRNMETNI
jgi:hypothetical protein